VVLGRDVGGPAESVRTVRLADLDPADLARVSDVNVTGTLLPCQRFARAAFAAGVPGSIVNVSSMSAFVVNVPQKQSVYNASKAAVDHLTRSLAVEWAPRGVRVNAIAPGFFVGEQNRRLLLDDDGELTERGRTIVARTPAGRFGEADELVGTLVWLCGRGADFVTGAVVPVDGGFNAFSGV
jgi:NAD(P)-dependent dehydrogenase (short-subunit alcohol dehydrogenase family)